jgi:hypothetical protein
MAASLSTAESKRSWQAASLSMAESKRSWQAESLSNAESNGALSEHSESAASRLPHITFRHVCHSSIPERKRPRSA